MLGELEFILSFKIKDPKHPKHCLAEVEVARVVDKGGVEVLVLRSVLCFTVAYLTKYT